MTNMDDGTWTIRKATTSDAYEIAGVQVASWHETYIGILPSGMIAALNIADRTQRWNDIIEGFSSENTGSAFIAISLDQTCGFISVRRQSDHSLLAHGFDGEITSIYVLQAAQCKGIGRALMRIGACHLSNSGCSSVALWVVEGNLKARHFYRALGGQEIEFREVIRSEVTLKKVAYGWSSLSRLIR